MILVYIFLIIFSFGLFYNIKSTILVWNRFLDYLKNPSEQPKMTKQFWFEILIMRHVLLFINMFLIVALIENFNLICV